MNILLLAILLVCILGVGAFVYFLWRISRIYNGIVTFITPIDAEHPSSMALVADSLAIMIARAVGAQLKTTFLGKQSGLIRGEQALQGELIQDQADAGGIGGLLNSFPGIKKSLVRNPRLLDLAVNFLAKSANNNRGNGHTVTASSGESPKFKL
jgi:hypothetical protein